MSFGKVEFLQLMSVVAILSIFVLNYYDSTHIRISLALVGLAWLVDLFWLINNTGRWYVPPDKSELFAGNSGFYKYCVVMTIIVQVVRVNLLYILFAHRSPESSSARHVVPLFADKVIEIGGQPSLLTQSIK
jgi:hypothetical protein